VCVRQMQHMWRERDAETHAGLAAGDRWRVSGR